MRNKPEHTRKSIAFWSSFVLTALIAVFWLTSFSLGGNDAKSKTISDISKTTNTPVKTLIAGVGIIFDDIRNLIMTPRKIQYGQIKASSGKK